MRFVAGIVGGATVLLLSACSRQSADHGSVSGALPAASGPVVEYLFEAEALSGVTGVFTVDEAAGASDEKALVVPAGLAKQGKIKGGADLVVQVPTDAQLNVWLRVKWTGTCSNSVIVKVPGLPAKIVGESATYQTWHWVQGPAFQAAAGEATVSLQAREDGIFVDQILVTSDSRRVPVGIETSSTTEGVVNDPGE